MTRRLVQELSYLAVALVGAAALARLTTGSPSLRAALVTALVGEILAAAVLVRFSVAAALLVGIAGVIVSALRNALPAATWHGVPTSTTFRAADHALRAVGGIHHVPVVASPGVVLVCALLSGVGAIATRVIPGSLFVLPSLGLLAESVVAIPSTGAAWLAVGLVGGGGAALLSRSDEVAGWIVASGAVIASALCVIVLSAVIGAQAGAISGGGRNVEGVPPTGLSLVSELTQLQKQDPNTVMFTVVTSVPSYWQITSLSVLKGNEWVVDAETAAAMDGHGMPAALPVVPVAPTFTARVTVANLSSRLLPVPPLTIQASGAVSTSAGFVSPAPTTPLERYSVTAAVPPNGAPNASAAGGTPTSALSPPGESSYTDLPKISPAVEKIAHAVTSSASTPLQKAEALTNWFRSGLFRYSLKASPSLTAFLTKVRSGSCEQFAGAFAVLARAIGLPTRVAVGFTTGVKDSAGQTVVRGEDAHAWPEVLIDGTWLSFEPTPELPSGELSPPGVIGPTGLGNPNPIGPSSVPTSIPHITLPSAVPTPETHLVAGRNFLWWWLSPTLAVALCVAVFCSIKRRRPKRTPEEKLIQAWKRVDTALDRTDLGRPPSRTPSTHARLLRFPTRDERWELLVDDLELLAAHLERSSYGAEPLQSADADHLEELSRRIAKSLKRTVGVMP